MATKENLRVTKKLVKGNACELHNEKPGQGEEKIVKGVVSSFRRLDGLPLVETEDGRVVIIQDFETKPQQGEEILYAITAEHGHILYGKRIEE